MWFTHLCRWLLAVDSLTRDLSSGGVEGGTAGHWLSVKMTFRFMGETHPFVLPRWSEQVCLLRDALSSRQMHSSLQTRLLPRPLHSEAVQPCPRGPPRPSCGEVHSLGWSHPVFMGLISAVKLLNSPKSSEHWGTLTAESEMPRGLRCQADSALLSVVAAWITCRKPL